MNKDKQRAMSGVLFREGKLVDAEALQSQSPLPGERMLRCGKCSHIIAESRAREHIRACWGYDIKDDEPIPNKPIIKKFGIR